MQIDNSLFSKDDLNYQDQQQRQVAACREFYTERPCDRISVLEFDEVEEPLERTRIYGPFGLEVLQWVRMNPFVVLMVDASGRECIEY